MGNPLLPIKISLADATASVKNVLDEKNWHTQKLDKIELNLVPYFLFNYHYFFEHEAEGHKIIKRSHDGILAFDAHKLVIDDDTTELIKMTWKEAVNKVPVGEFKEKFTNVGKKEELDVLALKTAQFFNVPKENVIISNLKRFFVPFYKAVIVFSEDESYSIFVNAVDGTIRGDDAVPTRKKGMVEVTKETIKDLRHPKNWVTYAADLIVDSGKAVAGAAHKAINGEEGKATEAPKGKAPAKAKGIDLSFFASTPMLVLIIVIALILIYLAFFK